MKENLTRYAFNALSRLVADGIERNLESVRIFRAFFSLYQTKLTLSDDSPLFADSQCLSGQLPDGGWSDPEETAWAASVLSQILGKDNEAVSRAKTWLNSARHLGGGWGRHSRDRARIPTTALVLTLLPEAGCDEDYEWISREWAKDLAGPVQLSYKAGFYLLAAPKPVIQGDSELIDRTICHLAQDQNNDGGFGPWRDHPIGSDPWSTGVVLWGMAKWIDRAEPEVIERALHWLQVTQLPSGYWPYHYLDEGTSYALIGAVSAMRAIASRR